MADEATATDSGADVVVVVLPEHEENRQMDIPAGVGVLIITETAGNIQGSNRRSRDLADVAMGALQATVVSNHAEVGLLEGRTASGIYATPIAGPTNAQKV